MIRRLLILLVVLLPLSVRADLPPEASCFSPGKPFERGMLGNWELPGWKVRYSLGMYDGNVCLTARDLSTGEWFFIPELQWDGKILRVAFMLLSNRWITESELSMEGNRIRDAYHFKGGQRVDYWERVQ